LFVAVVLGILVTFPKAQSKDLVGLGIRHKENFIHEPRLVFKDWENLVLNGIGELSRFSRLGSDGDDLGEHNVPPFGSGSVGHNLCSMGPRVNYPKMVQGKSARMWQTMISEREQPDDPMPEWLDLKALTGYACVSERTLREWIHRDSNPLPASRVVYPGHGGPLRASRTKREYRVG
jgi:hypothetical protein